LIRIFGEAIYPRAFFFMSSAIEVALLCELTGLGFGPDGAQQCDHSDDDAHRLDTGSPYSYGHIHHRLRVTSRCGPPVIYPPTLIADLSI
jgi:hypothetical protein